MVNDDDDGDGDDDDDADDDDDDDDDDDVDDDDVDDDDDDAPMAFGCDQSSIRMLENLVDAAIVRDSEKMQSQTLDKVVVSCSWIWNVLECKDRHFTIAK